MTDAPRSRYADLSNYELHRLAQPGQGPLNPDDRQAVAEELRRRAAGLSVAPGANKSATPESSAAGIGFVAGILLGYPLSYFVQPGALRAKISLGSYVQHIDQIMKDSELRTTAIGVWIGCAVLFPVIAWFIAKQSGNRSTGTTP